MNRLFSAGVVVLASGLAATSSINEAVAQQSSTTFVCGSSPLTNGQVVPTTVAKTQRGDVSVIRWVSSWATDSGFTPQKRCEIVSGKFQEFYSQGLLNYLTTDRVDGMPVICPATTQGGSCDGRVLFTLQPGADGPQTLQRLLEVRKGAASDALLETSSRVWIDMNSFLSEADTLGSAPAPAVVDPALTLDETAPATQQQPESNPLW